MSHMARTQSNDCPTVDCPTDVLVDCGAGTRGGKVLDHGARQRIGRPSLSSLLGSSPASGPWPRRRSSSFRPTATAWCWQSSRLRVGAAVALQPASLPRRARGGAPVAPASRRPRGGLPRRGRRERGRQRRHRIPRRQAPGLRSRAPPLAVRALGVPGSVVEPSGPGAGTCRLPRPAGAPRRGLPVRPTTPSPTRSGSGVGPFRSGGRATRSWSPRRSPTVATSRPTRRPGCRHRRPPAPRPSPLTGRRAGRRPWLCDLEPRPRGLRTLADPGALARDRRASPDAAPHPTAGPVRRHRRRLGRPAGSRT